MKYQVLLKDPPRSTGYFVDIILKIAPTTQLWVKYLLSDPPLLEPLISFMNSLAQKENVDCKIITALALQLVSSSSGDNSTSSFCKEIVSAGIFQSDTKRIIPIEKCTFLNCILGSSSIQCRNYHPQDTAIAGGPSTERPHYPLADNT